MIITIQEAINVIRCEMCISHEWMTDDFYEALNIVIDALEEPKAENMKRLTNAEWKDFLSEQFGVSKTSAREMLHRMMSVKKEDNFKKQFNQGRK